MKIGFLRNMMMVTQMMITVMIMNLDFTCHWTKKHNFLNHFLILKGMESHSFKLLYMFGDKLFFAMNF